MGKNKGKYAAQWTPKPAGGVRAPFQPANTVRLEHGAKSERVYLPVAKELAAGLIDARPDLAPYPVAVARWAEWEARALLLRKHFAEVGDLTSQEANAEGRPALSWLKTCENNASKAAAVLGLDPISEARLARERANATASAVDLAAIAERGRAALAGRATEPQLTPDAQPDPVATALEAVAAAGRAAMAEAEDVAERCSVCSEWHPDGSCIL